MPLCNEPYFLDCVEVTAVRNVKKVGEVFGDDSSTLVASVSRMAVIYEQWLDLYTEFDVLMYALDKHLEVVGIGRISKHVYWRLET